MKKTLLLIYISCLICYKNIDAQTIVIWDSAYTDVVHNQCLKADYKIKINITPNTGDTLFNPTLKSTFFQNYTNISIKNIVSIKPVTYQINTSNILFTFDTITSNEIITIEFSALPNCNSISGGPFRDTFLFYDNTTNFTQLTNIYNVSSPVLSILSSNNSPNNVNEGDYFTRYVELVNGGFGKVNNLIFKDLLSGGNFNIDINSFKIFNGNDTSNISPSNITINDSVLVNLNSNNFSQINNLDSFLDLNEIFFLCYRIQLNECSNSSEISIESNFYTNCLTSLCHRTSSNSQVIITPSAPVELILNIVPNYNLQCFEEIFCDTFYLINNSPQTINNVNVQINSGTNGRYLIRDSVYSKYNYSSISKHTSLSSVFSTTACIDNHAEIISLVIDSLQSQDSIMIFYYHSLCSRNNCPPYHESSYNFGNISISANYIDQCRGTSVSTIGNNNLNYTSYINTQQFSGGRVYHQDSTLFEIKSESFGIAPIFSTSFIDIILDVPSRLTQTGLFNKSYYINRGDTLKNALIQYKTNHYRNPTGNIVGQKSIYFNFIANCAASSQEFDTLRVRIQGYYDTSCLPIPLMCFEIPIHISCSNNCDSGGVAFNYFHSKRNNIGLKDNDNDGRFDDSTIANHELVRLKSYTNGDKLEFVYQGTVDTGNSRKDYQYLLATISSPNFLTNFKIDTSYFCVKRNGIDSCYPSTLFFNNNDSFVFQCLGIDSFVHNDSLKFYLLCQNIEKLQMARLPIDRRFNAHFYLKEFAPAVVENLFECQLQTDIMKQYLTNYIINIGNTNPIINCNSNEICFEYHTKTNSTNPLSITDEFEYESRYLVFPDTFVWIYPNAYQIGNLDLNFNRRTSPTGITSPIIISNIPYFINSDTIKLLKDSFLKYIPYFDESYFVRFCFDVSSSNCLLIDSLVHSDSVFWKFSGTTSKYLDSALKISNAPSLTTVNPLVNFNGTNFVENVNNNKLTWNLRINHPENSVIPNVWIIPIKLNSETILDSVFYRGNKIVPNDSGFYLLDTLYPNSFENIQFYLRVRSCNRDTIDFRMGYNCSTYPNSIYEFSKCSLPNVSLITIPQASEVQSLVTQLNQTSKQISLLNGLTYGANTITMCDTFPIELNILSARNASIYNTEFTINLPINGANRGFEFIRDSLYIIYPENTVPRKARQLAINRYNTATNQLTFTLQELDSINFNSENYLPGITSPGNNLFKIRFLALSNCDYISGSYFTTTTSATNICNEPAIGNNFTTSSPAYNIDGFTSTYITRISLTDSIFSNCKSDKISFFVNKIGSDTVKSTDSVIVILNSTIKLDSIKNFTRNILVNFQKIYSNGTQIIKFSMPRNMNNNDSIFFDVIGKDTGSISCQSLLNCTINTTQQIQAYCELISAFCNNSQILSGSYNGNYSLIKPQLYFQNFNAEVSRFSLPFRYNYYYRIGNNSTELIVENDSFEVEIYFDYNNNLIFDVGDTLIKTVKHRYFNSLSNTSFQDSLVANYPVPSETLNMFGIIRKSKQDSTFCNCDTMVFSPVAIALPRIENELKCSQNNCSLNFEYYTNDLFDKLILQVSQDGINFENIIELIKIENINYYTFKNVIPSQNVEFYRIVKVKNQLNEFSNIVEMQNNCRKNLVKLYPNPSENIVNVALISNFSKTNLQIRVLNYLGEEIYKFVYDEKNSQIKFNKNGIYLIEIYSNNQLIQIEKVVIIH